MSWVSLDVGGKKFAAKLSTLTSVSTSLLAKMVSSNSMGNLASSCSHCLDSDMMQNNVSYCGCSGHHEENEVRLDCDPECFAVILNYLRYGTVVLPPSLSPTLLCLAAGALGLRQEIMAGIQQSSGRKETAIPKEMMTDWIKLNVGGEMFETTRATLTSHPDSALARMFEPNSKFSPATMDGGVYQVDACPRAFSVVLNWLRYRHLMLGPDTRADEVAPVADFFGLDDLNIQLTKYNRAEGEKAQALVESLENCTERLEDVLQQIQGGLHDCVEKLDDINQEVACVGSSMEDLWRIKCVLQEGK